MAPPILPWTAKIADIAKAAAAKGEYESVDDHAAVLEEARAEAYACRVEEGGEFLQQVALHVRTMAAGSDLYIHRFTCWRYADELEAMAGTFV